MQFTVERAEQSNLRIDRFLAEKLPDLSRSRLQSLIKDGHITLNGNSTKPKRLLSEKDVIEISIPPLTQPEAKPENIKLNILHEDEHLIVINKPRPCRPSSRRQSRWNTCQRTAPSLQSLVRNWRSRKARDSAPTR